jgi:hypothetical protein
MQKLLRWFTLASAVLVVGALLVIPMGTYQSVSVDSGGSVTRAGGRTTFLEGQGLAGIVVLSLPVLASLCAVLPWPAKARRAVDVASAAIVTVFCILASLSVGPFFYPTAAALLILAARPKSRGPAT